MNYNFLRSLNHDISCIHLHSSPFTDTLRPNNGLKAQLVVHCTGIAEVKSWNPVQARSCFLSGVYSYTGIRGHALKWFN